MARFPAGEAVVRVSVERAASAQQRHTSHTGMKTNRMQAGSETLKSIEAALQDLRRDEQDLRKQLQDAGNERTAIMTKRLDAFKELARVRARHAIADGVIDQADRLSEQVESILSARQKTVESLNARAEAAEAMRAQKLAEHEALLAKIEDFETELDRLAEEARNSLADDPAYSAATKAFEQAEAIFIRAEKKSKQAAEDRKTKGEPFEKDPLFMYLWRRDYGGKDYKPNGLIKWLDEKVAALVGYHDARANYAVLNEIPLRLGEHVARLGKKLAREEQAVAEIEAARIRKLAGSDLPKQLGDARAEQKALHAVLEKIAGELSETTSQVNIYAEGRDRSFLQAVELSAGFLEQESLDRLRRLARETAEPSDDAIVRRIRKFEDELEDLRGSNLKLQSKLERISKRKDELIRLAADFRHSYYDDPGSVFTSRGDADRWLELLLRGAITVAEYWVRAQAGHTWRSRPADPFRRSSSLPPFGGGFNWPSNRGRRSGGSDGDDFRTGGGF